MVRTEPIVARVNVRCQFLPVDLRPQRAGDLLVIGFTVIINADATLICNRKSIIDASSLPTDPSISTDCLIRRSYTIPRICGFFDVGQRLWQMTRRL